MVKMMPEQEPYSSEELEKLYRIIDQASRADVTEENEAEVMELSRGRSRE